MEKSFQKPNDFSLSGHLEGAFGVFGAQNPCKIRVQFTGWAATNVREMHWHPSQKIVSNDTDKVVATYDLGNTVEFKRWVLGFGPAAKVLEPASLAQDIARDLKQASEQYAPMHKRAAGVTR